MKINFAFWRSLGGATSITIGPRIVTSGECRAYWVTGEVRSVVTFCRRQTILAAGELQEAVCCRCQCCALSTSKVPVDLSGSHTVEPRTTHRSFDLRYKWKRPGKLTMNDMSTGIESNDCGRLLAGPPGCKITAGAGPVVLVVGHTVRVDSVAQLIQTFAISAFHFQSITMYAHDHWHILVRTLGLHVVAGPGDLSSSCQFTWICEGVWLIFKLEINESGLHCCQEELLRISGSKTNILLQFHVILVNRSFWTDTLYLKYLYLW